MSACVIVNRGRSALVLVAILAALPGSVLAGGGGGPPVPPIPIPGPSILCKDVPTPAYLAWEQLMKIQSAAREACKVAVKCNTAPFGGTYCNMSQVSFCNRVTNPRTVAEDAARIAAASAVCSMVPPANQIQGKARIALVQAAASCAASTANAQPHIKDNFCHALDEMVGLCDQIPMPPAPTPKAVNVCKPPWEW